MSDKLISQLELKASAEDTDQIAVEGGGSTWRLTFQKLRDYLYNLLPVLSLTATAKEDFVLLKQFGNDQVYRVSLGNLLPVSVVATRHLEDSVSSSTGITEPKIAPAAVTHPKLAVDSVHTHNVANAEPVARENWTSKEFGTGITTEKIVDGAVTGIKGGVPVGAVFHFAGTSAPAGYLECDGGVIPAYNSSNPGEVFAGVPVWRLQDLRNFLGGQFGATGKLPDLRGLFVRGTGSHGTQTIRSFVEQRNGVLGTAYTVSNFETNTARADTTSYTFEIYAGTDSSCLVKESETTVLASQQTVTFTAGKNVRIFANKRAKGLGLGGIQGDSTRQHLHDLSDPGHTHTLSGGGASGSFVTSVSSSQKKVEGAPGDGFNVTVINGVSSSSGSVSYSHPSVSSPTTGIKSERWPFLNNATVDETRPVNISLLACIKY